MQVAASTHIGGKARNEDTFFHSLQPDGSLYLGVFDGHCDYGLEIAEAVRDFFKAADPAALDANPVATFASAEAVARKAILAAAAAKGITVTEHPDQTTTYYDSWLRLILRGGTTASTVHITGDKLVHHHVGDSEVMVIHEPTGDYTVLTKDHSSTSVAEYERIVQEADIVPKVGFAFMTGFRPVFVTVGDRPGSGFKINPLGGVRTCNLRKDWSAYLYGKGPDNYSDGDGLNMMRSIGDFSLKKHAVTAAPDTVEFTLRPGRNIILTASDGLFDNYTYDDLRDMVMAAVKKSPDATAAAHAVVEEGVTTGFKNFGPKGQDNTTAVLCLVDVPGAEEGEPAAPISEPASPASELAEHEDLTLLLYLSATAARRCMTWG